MNGTKIQTQVRYMQTPLYGSLSWTQIFAVWIKDIQTFGIPLPLHVQVNCLHPCTVFGGWGAASPQQCLRVLQAFQFLLITTCSIFSAEFSISSLFPPPAPLCSLCPDSSWTGYCLPSFTFPKSNSWCQLSVPQMTGLVCKREVTTQGSLPES